MPRNPGGTVSGFKLLSTPDAPTITGVTTSIGSASVAFTAPTDTGDGAISSYVVTAVDESSGVSTGVSGASSPISISPGGGTFKIRMQALNPYGPGRLTEYDTGNAIYSGAELYAWGANSSGGLGDGTVDGVGGGGLHRNDVPHGATSAGSRAGHAGVEHVFGPGS